VYDFVNVLNNEARLQQALIRDKDIENLYILPASQTRDKDALTDEGVARIMDELSQDFDYIVCDSPAGIERGAILAMYHADEAIIVTNPEISSVRDSDRIIGMLDSKTKKVEKSEGRIRKHLCITRFNPERAEKQEMLTVDDISKDILKVPTLGVIPECKSILQASNEGKPAILYPDSPAGQAYDDLVARFLGEDRPYRHLEIKQKGWLARLFGA
jgi:septum site-determining protein MinD